MFFFFFFRLDAFFGTPGKHRALSKTRLRHDDETLDGLFELYDGCCHGRQEPVELHHLLLQHDRQRRQQSVLLNIEKRGAVGVVGRTYSEVVHRKQQSEPKAVLNSYSRKVRGERGDV